jgi:hypothetical protein
MSEPRSVVIHGHFYQPPREDPWLDEVPRELNAAPFHDWNERIERESYRAVVAARLTAADGRIAGIVNTLEQISFDAGPTLLAWMEDAAPSTYRAILAADRASAARLDGHGNALAAPYHHVILPLSTPRDRRTELLWGIADFVHRFGRRPEGLWLPETAVDDDTLAALAEAGIRFTILAPHQIAPLPARGLPGLVRTRGGRTIAVCPYDGALAHDVAFGPMVRDGAAWAARVAAPGDARLVAVATDGETFGHHHRFGEMALAAALDDLNGRDTVRVENFASFLARDPALPTVELTGPASWSCPHGVERWRAACGCRVAPERETSQAWRAPLRDALATLADGLHQRFQHEGAGALGDPWAARDAYGAVVVGAVPLDAWLSEWCPTADDRARRRVAELLEMERHALGMFTSCGWFFDDLGGLEGRQVLRYAARALDLAGPAGAPLERALRERLADAASNDAALGTGRDLYDAIVHPDLPAAVRAAAGYAAAAAVGAAADAAVPRAFVVAPTDADGGFTVRHCRTGALERMTATVERPGPGALEAAVTLSDGRAWRVPLERLPERATRLVAPELAREIIDLWFTDAEAQAVCRGTPLTDAAGGALLRSLVALRDDSSPMAVAEVTDLLDLFALLDHPVPFDAQTVFHQVRAALPPQRAGDLIVLGRRLGFV